MEESTVTYIVENVIHETPHVVTLQLQCETSLVTYRPGQFITVYFPETGHMEGKSYSISSAPHEKLLSITVKEIGVFSKKLTALQCGDKISASLPYGYFYSDSDSSSLVIITGGIGIAPFRSMILDVLHRYKERRVVLFCSNKTMSDIIFKKEFNELTKTSNGRFSVQYYCTQERGDDSMKHGRIPVSDILNLSEELHDREFFICGSISFVRDYWRGLKENGIPEERLYTEAFF